MRKPSRASLFQRAKKIKLIAMDVDGVLTAGDIVILDSGEEVKFWSSKDRYVMSLVRKMENPPILAWITGRKSNAVERAAREFNISHLVQGCSDKKSALLAILKERNIKPEEAAFIGDDLIDLGALNTVGLAVCPFDAVEELFNEVHYVSPLGGGKGVFRDVLKLVLQAQKRWDPLIESLRE
jgi:3-deoxy-D-manno-octulosonate 8-phosphate phosphatase (KDO 8-P phosphatase)